MTGTLAGHVCKCPGPKCISHPIGWSRTCLSWPGSTSRPSSSSMRWIPSVDPATKMRARLPEGSKRSSWSRCRVCAVLGFLLFLGPPTVSQGLIIYPQLDSVVLRVEGSGPQLPVLRPSPTTSPPFPRPAGQAGWGPARGGTGTALVQDIKPLKSFPLALTDPSKCSESMSCLPFSTGVGNNNDGTLVLGATNIPWVLDSAIRRR